MLKSFLATKTAGKKLICKNFRLKALKPEVAIETDVKIEFFYEQQRNKHSHASTPPPARTLCWSLSLSSFFSSSCAASACFSLCISSPSLFSYKAFALFRCRDNKLEYLPFFWKV